MSCVLIALVVPTAAVTHHWVLPFGPGDAICPWEIEALVADLNDDEAYFHDLHVASVASCQTTHSPPSLLLYMHEPQFPSSGASSSASTGGPPPEPRAAQLQADDLAENSVEASSSASAGGPPPGPLSAQAAAGDPLGNSGDGIVANATFEEPEEDTLVATRAAVANLMMRTNCRLEKPIKFDGRKTSCQQAISRTYAGCWELRPCH